MTPIFWAGLVAAGVAVATMAIFAARLTRRQTPEEVRVEEFVPSADPDDPWAAYRPRPFDEVERHRPRMWPAVAGVFGLVLVAGGVVGARQSTSIATLEAAPTTKPYIVDVKPPATPEPTPAPTPEPTAEPTAKPIYHTAAAKTTSKPAVAASTSGTGPKISGFMSCSGGSLHLSASLSGAKLSWFGVYVDGKVAKGGPISGASYSTSYSKAAAKGDHTAEVTADDAAHHHSSKVFTAHCV